MLILIDTLMILVDRVFKTLVKYAYAPVATMFTRMCMKNFSIR